MSRDVTILLTLKGRPLHTLRWMWHHDRIRLPFKVVVADGGDDPEIERLLSDPNSFPNLDFVYWRYHDRTWADYWFKLHDCMNRIDTKYAMTVDNDDFILAPSLLRSKEFLDDNADYVSAGSHICAFTILEDGSYLNNVHGDPVNVWLATNKYDFTNENATDRLANKFGGSIVFYYNLNRTSLLRTIYSAYNSLRLSNLDIAEFLFEPTALLSGKVKFFSDIGYMRQVGTSQNYANMEPMLTRIIYKNWVGELDAVVARCAEVAMSLGTAEPTVAGEIVRSQIHDHFFRRLANDCVRVPSSARWSPVTAARGFLKAHLPAARHFHFKKKWKTVAAILRRDGIENKEEAAMKAAVDQVVETLSTPQFPAYLAQLQTQGHLP